MYFAKRLRFFLGPALLPVNNAISDHIVKVFQAADWRRKHKNGMVNQRSFTFSLPEMVNFLAAINKIQLNSYFHCIFQCL
jgi:hypothetical protein